ncbi:hypothetical protein [Peribacillus sp. Hz7]|uniref:hypothetical protein n=1 Tax=Peribacillus sp. Hz7 TaxID=3344873 RepID=UPI0035CA67F0
MSNIARQVAASLLFLMAFTIFPLLAAAEQPKISISIEEGLGGYAKRSAALPVKVEIENKGEAFSGTLLLQFQATYQLGGSQAIRVELPKGSVKTYSITLPAYTDENYSSSAVQQTIHLYEGDWKKGKEVAFKGTKVIAPKFVDSGEVQIGILSEKYDRLKEWRVLPSSPTNTFDLTKGDLPKEARGYDVLTYLVIDEFSMSTLDHEQQEAIAEWVQNGGILIAGATPNASQQYDTLYDLLPMKPNKEVTISSAFLGTGKQAPSFKQIPSFVGEVEKEAGIMVKSDNHPVVVKKEFGSGMIIQTSFSLGDEPLASWNKYGTWVESTLLTLTTNNPYNQMDNLLNNLEWELSEPNKWFDHTNFSTGQLILLLIIYLLILIPLLYVVLKKLDKREHAWWSIPVIAIISSVVIFALGAKDRIAQPQLNQLGIYQVNHQHVTGIQSNVLLSNTSGDYKLSFAKGEMLALPSAPDSVSGNPLRAPVVEEKAKEVEIEFPGVEYWSTRSLVGRISQKQAGEFKADLKVENKKLAGTIVNNLNYDFEEIMIVSGNQKWDLGALKKGEMLTVNQKLKTDFLMRPTMSFPSSMHTWKPGQKVDWNQVRNDQLLYLASQYFFNGQTADNAPVIIGLTKEQVTGLKLENGKMKEHNNNLIFQTFEADTTLSGEVSLPKEMFQWRIETINGHYEVNTSIAPSSYWLEVGEYEAYAQMPAVMEDPSFKVSKLTIKWTDSKLQYALYNVKTGNYEPIAGDERILTLEGSKKINAYLSADGELKVKLLKKQDPNGAENRLPVITVDGEVTP